MHFQLSDVQNLLSYVVLLLPGGEWYGDGSQKPLLKTSMMVEAHLSAWHAPRQDLQLL